MAVNNKFKDVLFQISAILVLVAAIVHNFDVTIAKYLMLVGVSGYAVSVFTTGYTGKSIRGKRLYNILIFSVLLMAVSAYLMFADMNQWVITLLIAAVLTLYASIILPRVYKKEQDENNS